MTLLEDIVEEIERSEDDSDMHFSLYSMPYYYQPEEEEE